MRFRNSTDSKKYTPGGRQRFERDFPCRRSMADWLEGDSQWSTYSMELSTGRELSLLLLSGKRFIIPSFSAHLISCINRG